MFAVKAAGNFVWKMSYKVLKEVILNFNNDQSKLVPQSCAARLSSRQRHEECAEYTCIRIETCPHS